MLVGFKALMVLVKYLCYIHAEVGWLYGGIITKTSLFGYTEKFYHKKKKKKKKKKKIR